MATGTHRERRAGGSAARPVGYRYVDTEAELAAVVAELQVARRYAIDTEFHRERTYYPHLALVQLAFDGRAVVLDPLAVDVGALAPVLKGPGLAVFHACEQDLEVLERCCGTVPSRLFDTQIAAGFLGYSTPSLGALIERELGVVLEKGDQLTDWTRRPLQPAQLAYAANDVAYLLELHDALGQELSARGRLAWAEDECTLALARGRQPTVPERAWWRLKQARQLRGRARGVAQEVGAWRERRAQELDIPVRFVLSDLALVGIAQRPPRSRQELDQVRGLDARHLHSTAVPELLAAIERGGGLGADALMLPPRSRSEPVARPAVAIAAAWVAERARELEIDLSILATRADLAAFLADAPSGRLVDTWRHDLVGEPIRRLVAGEAAIALSKGSIVLEERSYRALSNLEGPPREDD